MAVAFGKRVGRGRGGQEPDAVLRRSSSRMAGCLARVWQTFGAAGRAALAEVTALRSAAERLSLVPA